MKFITILLLSITMSSCGYFDRKIIANITGSAESCISGVSYLQFASGASVKYTKDGKIATC